MPVLKDADDVRLGADGASRVYLGAVEVWSAVTIVEHGSDAEFVRPAVNTVHWFGSVMPDNGQTSDVWFMVRPHLSEPDPWDYDATIGGGVWVRRSDGELGYPGPEMRFTFTTLGPSARRDVELALHGDVNLNIDWGDGTVETGVTTDRPRHTYAVDGSYDVVVSGTATSLGSTSGLRWGRRLAGFRALGRLGITDMFEAFFRAEQLDDGFYGDAWDVSGVTAMRGVFRDASVFNRPIGAWDVSNVTDMFGMFQDASSFNQPIGDWDTSNVTRMIDVFNGASAFNQPIGDWDVSSVAGFARLFRNASAFDQPIGDWDMSNATNTPDMFNGASAFNQPVGSWDLSNVTTMLRMFSRATAFNQPVGDWDVSSVTNMGSMFVNASSFNQPVGGWDVSSVTGMGGMFREADAFQQPLNSWTFTSNVVLGDFMADKTGGNSYNTPDYNALLIRWNQLVTAGTLSNNGITDMGGAQHSGAGTTARNNLIAAGWSITDGGPA